MSLVIETIYGAVWDSVNALEGTSVYGVTISSVPRRLAKGQVSPEHGQIVVEFGDATKVETYPGSPAAEEWQQTFLIRIFTRDESETDDWSLVATRYAMAVKKNVAGTNDWHTFGDFAVDAEFTDLTHSPPNGGFAVSTWTLLVRYRISELDPEVQR
jgi:hypothetical protein